MKIVMCAALFAGSLTAAPAAAATACYAGTWTLTAMKVVDRETLPEGGVETTVHKGKPLIKMVLSATSVKYTFTGSKKTSFTRTGGVEDLRGWHQYSGVLTMRAKVVGDTKGRVAMIAKGASGNAGETGNFIPSTQPVGDPVPLLSGLEDGFYDTPLVKNAAFTCSGDSMRFVDKRTYRKITTAADLRFTRASQR
ncbi:MULTISPECIES: hypothetical protein [Nonomuraea]|uniref:APCDD1 domain-containing protein n=1 Tax=Nonomuraea mangrovi TaxID=2316207 RepID=A0ABW4TA56_9ACTN